MCTVYPLAEGSITLKAHHYIIVSKSNNEVGRSAATVILNEYLEVIEVILASPVFTKIKFVILSSANS